MACAILERTSGLEPSSETTASRYLKLVTVPISAFLPLSVSGCHCHFTQCALVKSHVALEQLEVEWNEEVITKGISDGLVSDNA